MDDAVKTQVANLREQIGRMRQAIREIDDRKRHHGTRLESEAFWQDATAERRMDLENSIALFESDIGLLLRNASGDSPKLI